MKKLFMFLLTAGLLLGCAMADNMYPVYSPNLTTVPPSPTPTPTPTMVGGYTPVKVNDPLVVSALAFLQQNFPAIKIKQVKSAGQQVVAGLNVKMICLIDLPGDPQMWELTVYQDLNGNLQFTGAK